VAILVPCHRVLNKDGSISGYRWGVFRKRALLERESVVVATRLL
jgi:AraC family transcriptional regulator of adaptative response/methylated-DNA-[protein]-cysteine methyltransferase